MLGVYEVAVEALATITYSSEMGRSSGCLTECPFRQDIHLDT